MARKSSWSWILAGFALLLLGFLLITTLLNRWLLGGGATLAAHNVLRVQLSGPLVERPAVLWSDHPVGPLGLHEIDRVIRRAAHDQRIVGLQLEVGPSAAGFAKAQEVRAAIQVFRATGKPTVSRLELGSTVDYYIAAAAEHVVQVPHGTLLLGLVSRTQYYRELFDKLGVHFEVFHTGPYKTAMNPYTAKNMDVRERRALESLLNSVWEQILDDVAADRGGDRDQIARAFDVGLLSAEDALDHGLVDTVADDDKVRELAGDAPRIGVRDYWRASGGDGSGLWSKPTIAIVHVDGMILPGAGAASPLFGSWAGADTLAEALARARDDRSVRAVVVRIDSPGGAVSASEVIGNAVAKTAAHKPVIVSMSDVAASGGYWIAMGATRVFADQATFTGSIGVVSSRVDLRGTYEKLGVGNAVVKRGRNADMFVDSQPLTSEQREILQRFVTNSYQAFLRKVAAGRGLSVSQVQDLAAGRVWTGQQAVANGLVDSIGGLAEALDAAAEAAGISVESYEVKNYPRPRSLFEQLSGMLTRAQANVPLSLQRGLSEIFAPSARVHDVARIAALLQSLQRAGYVWALAWEPLPAAPR